MVYMGLEINRRQALGILTGAIVAEEGGQITTLQLALSYRVH